MIILIIAYFHTSNRGHMPPNSSLPLNHCNNWSKNWSNVNFMKMTHYSLEMKHQLQFLKINVDLQSWVQFVEVESFRDQIMWANDVLDNKLNDLKLLFDSTCLRARCVARAVVQCSRHSSTIYHPGGLSLRRCWSRDDINTTESNWIPGWLLWLGGNVTIVSTIVSMISSTSEASFSPDHSLASSEHKKLKSSLQILEITSGWKDITSHLYYTICVQYQCYIILTLCVWWVVSMDQYLREWHQ